MSNTEFEPGQRIRCVDAECAESLKLGEIYEVRDCNRDYVYVRGVTGGWRLDRFVDNTALLTHMGNAFEAGQRVVCLDSGYYTALKAGTTYTVFACSEEYVHLLDVGGGWLPSRFKLVEEGVDPKVYAQPESAPSRTNDPATSKGKRKTNKYEQSVLTYLSLYRDDGGTGKEIAGKHTALNCITPRFAPLRRKGLIKDSGQRRDKQIVWVLT